MISIEEAQTSILSGAAPLGLEEVPLLQGLNRVTPADHIAPWDIPLTDNSAMDGYAFSSARFSGRPLQVTGFLPAGGSRAIPLPPGEAIRIMTGAPIPPGCDTVVPFEDAAVHGDLISLSPGIKKGAHVRRRGEDIRCGDVVISAGSCLRPQELGMLAAMGTTVVTVYRKARVAILATGDELMEPGATPLPGRVVNSNSYTLAALVGEAGGEATMLGIAPDLPGETCAKIRAGLRAADMVLTTGGASVGDHDFVKAAIERLGGTITFWKVNVKPGKPLAFATLEGKPVFALPGNPAAAMVSFELFVRPYLLKAMGHQRIFRPKARAVMQEPVANDCGRPHLVRGIVARHNSGYVVSTTGNQSSGRLSSLTRGNALIHLAPESSYSAGDTVEVLLLDQRFEMGETVEHAAALSPRPRGIFAAVR
ncbi:molybdopterin molybdotransferase MoeA [Geobacter sp. FeAm09]|uniref:molybdopterin molybdotransferase MoeA n=1 Tax=Geobacter sp. FeAm09 TaxID=2597769 RepID=UPI0011ECD6A3|nr:gephyrin-like molybdotransferase Glp [Geobacter sp. FeAm09]QEM67652.1 molybdopterin molybdotransferase MoeA [Geobacter sp. FeAm09]